jgi:hypothetical protein
MERFLKPPLWDIKEAKSGPRGIPALKKIFFLIYRTVMEKIEKRARLRKARGKF